MTRRVLVTGGSGFIGSHLVEPAGSRPRPASSPVRLIPYQDAYPVGFEDMRRRVPDTTKVETLTGWRVRRTLDDILSQSIAEARAEQAAAVTAPLA